jgi:1-acyl-sn-glycerol-3-phosphate acyltransferase
MRTVLLVLLFVLYLVFLIPALPLCALFGLREPLITAGYGLVRLGRRILGIKLEVSGLDGLDPRTAYIFMSNHLSVLDGPLLMAYLGRPCRVILKKSILRVPVLGTGMRYVGFVPVDRKRAKGGMKSIALAARLIEERGYSFLIFPEGTRSRDGNVQAFRRGGFFLALASRAPIVPVTVRGTFELMPKGQLYARKGTVRICFHAPVPVEGFTRDNLDGLMDKVREAVLSAPG